MVDSIRLSFESNRVTIPAKLRTKILSELHEAHIGIVRMKALASTYVWWPGIDSDIEQLVKNCLGCQSVSNQPSKAPIHHWEHPSKPMERIHVDFAGPFYGSYFMLIVDAYSKWPEIVTMKNITTFSTINVLRRFFCSFGIPEILVSDNGGQFTSYEFQQFLKSNGIRHKQSAPYHPATNGQVERYVQDMKQSIRAMQFERGSVEIKLQRYLIAYRRAPHSTTGQSPSHLFIGRQIRSRLEILYPNLSNKMNKKFDAEMDDDFKRYLHRNDPVAYRTYNDRKWEFGKVLNKKGTRSYEIETRNGIVKRHIDQLKETGNQLATEYLNADNSFSIEDRLNYKTCNTPEIELEQNSQEQNQLQDDPPEENKKLITPFVVRRSSRTRKPISRLNL